MRGLAVWSILGSLWVLFTALLCQIFVFLTSGFEGLGAYNRLIAIYTICGQLSCMGIPLAVFDRVAQNAGDWKRQSCTHAILAFAIGLLVSAAIAVVGTWTDLSIELWVFSLPFFAANKAILSGVHAAGAGKLLGILLGARGGLLLLITALLLRAGFDGAICVLGITGSEVIFSLILFAVVNSGNSRTGPKIGNLLREILAVDTLRSNGTRFGASLLTDVNTKVDLLLLGFLLSDRIVGIYAPAAMYMVGILQICQGLKGVFASRFSGNMVDNQGALNDAQRIGTFFGIAVALVGLLAGLALILYSDVFRQSAICLLILAVSFGINARWIVLDLLPNQRGDVGWQLSIKAVVFCVNVILNLLLISWLAEFDLGAEGAAIATAIAFAAHSMLIAIYRAKKTL